jgi:hypothetical protein
VKDGTGSPGADNLGRSMKAATVTNLEDHTSVDSVTGAVRSVQTADLLLAKAVLAEIWSPTQLERLARTYWRFLTRVTLGLIRVSYTEAGCSVVLLVRPLKLLTFHAPEYEMEPSRGLVRWRIARGLLVAKRGHDDDGYLQIEVRRNPPIGARSATEPAPLAEDRADNDPAPACLHVEVEVANFYPSIASGLSRWFYNLTQSRIHVIVTRGFLRSLARLDLADRSETGQRVGRSKKS